MKHFLTLCALLTCALFAGCATSSQVAQSEGSGKRMVFQAPYEVVWRAAVDAAQAGELDVRTVDKARGYIGATRGLQMHTMGENVGVWVKRVSPSETQVEVLSRQAGLPVAWFKNWENQILHGIEANLTRESNYRGGIEEPAGSDRYNDLDQDRYQVPSAEPPIDYDRKP